MSDIYTKEIKGKLKFFHGKGCANCGDTGYVGRTVVSEVLEVGIEFKNLIARDFTLDDVKEQLKKQNFLSLFQDGILKVLKGQTTAEEIIRVTQN